MRIADPLYETRNFVDVYIEHLSAAHAAPMVVVSQCEIETIWTIRNLDATDTSLL